MTHLRKENLAIVTRNTAEDHWVTNLEGTKSRSVSWCNECRVYKPLSAFYLEPLRTRKHKNHVRTYCCICFDQNNKKSRAIREHKTAQKSLGLIFGLINI